MEHLRKGIFILALAAGMVAGGFVSGLFQDTKAAAGTCSCSYGDELSIPGIGHTDTRIFHCSCGSLECAVVLKGRGENSQTFCK